MSEATEPRQTEAPDCFPKDWTEPEQEQYWTTTGTLPSISWWKLLLGAKTPRAVEMECHSTVFASAEEAEAFAVTIDAEAVLIWDGKPAHSVTVKEAMRKARKRGRRGVRAIAFREGQWVTVHTWKAEEPVL